ncbi:PREDICTED: aspartic and glutamic acid-rich protein-like [Eufriesea mexicana]|uniref:aspartic and glutamic acid-rich protein-like n=1 Tax=Eufriesea mexicana TaxID=516756 RepID=UPI00083BF67A|nr:PREDICTED: aspartic and glutamic acid-rich protein-like [Eufriesea mexicana]
MKVTTVVELLLILLLVAFAAYGRVIEHDGKAEEGAVRDMRSSEESNAEISTLPLKQATDTVNRYCTCNENICNCCRDFHIPLVQFQGPGCASLQYLQGNELAVQLSFGNNILTSTIVNGKSPKPVCVPLPGGFTKFCGRIYSIKREARNNFKACLGLELQSSTEIEASLRVGCFRFGPEGVNLRPAEPLPVIETEVPEEEEDDDDLFGLGSDDDDEEEDTDYDTPVANSATNSSTEEEEEEDDDDVLGFGALLDIITGDDETTKKPKGTTPTPFLQFTIPILTKPTSSPVNFASVDDDIAANDSEESNEYNQESSNVQESDAEEESAVDDAAEDEAEEVVTVVSNKIASYAKPNKLPMKKFTASNASKKKPSITGSSINAIENEVNKKKPLKKPVKDDDDDVDDILEDDLDEDDDDDDDEEELLDEDDEKNSEEEDGDEKVDESEQENHEDEEDKAEVESLVDDDDDDDDDEEEDAVISALVYDEKTDGKKKGKVKKHYQTMEADDDDADYGLGLTGLLARSRHSRNSHQSKDVRL